MKVAYGSQWGSRNERTAANARIIRMLAAKGADVNAKNNDGKTALLLAVQFSDPEIIEALLSVGADPNAVAKDGSTALFVVAGPAPKPLKPADPNKPLEAAAMKKIKEAQAREAARRKPDVRKERIIELLKKAGARE